MGGLRLESHCTRGPSAAEVDIETVGRTADGVLPSSDTPFRVFEHFMMALALALILRCASQSTLAGVFCLWRPNDH